MNFEYNQDQQAFKDSVSKFLRDQYDFESRQAIVKSEAAFSKEVWQSSAELGWLSLPFSEEQGGFGGSAVDTILLFEELGKNLLVEPFLETLVLAGGVLRRSATPLANSYIEPLIAGELQGALAHFEARSRGKLTAIDAQAQITAAGFEISGQKSVVYNAPSADILVVSAIVASDAQQAGELLLFVIEKDAAGLSLQSYPTVDGREAAEVSLNKVQVSAGQLLARGEQALSILEATLDEALLAQTAEMVGAMDVLLQTTVEYSKERKQFGVSLSKFQVLQHRMTEMLMAGELSRSLMYAAAIKLRDGTDDARLFVAAAKVKADKCAKLSSQAAVQLHGGIGTTDELKVGHYMKRIEVIRQLFGGADFHIARFKELQQSL